MENIDNAISNEILDIVYNKFIENTNYISISSVINDLHLENGKIISKLVYKKYDRNFLRKEMFKRLNLYRRTKKGKRSLEAINKAIETRHNNGKPWHTEQTKEKIKKSNIIIRNSREDLKEISRNNMLKYCSPNSKTKNARKKAVETRHANNKPWHSDVTKEKIRESHMGLKPTIETRNKMSDAKIGKSSGRKGSHHSLKTIELLRAKTKQQWLDGKCNNTTRSLGQIEVCELLKNKLNLDCSIDYAVGGKLFDIFVKDKNLLIEFNGTYWHRDSRFYERDEIVMRIHANDELKETIATYNNFNFKVIWQYDWETCVNKIEFLRKIIYD